MESGVVDDKHEPPSSTVLVAVNSGVKSRYAVTWALENLAVGRILFFLLHVFPTIKTVPTEMGNYIPISLVRPDKVADHKKKIEWKINEMLLSHMRLDVERKVEMEVMAIEADDVPQAIAGVVSELKISKLVIGASSNSWFTRILKRQSISSRISECIPSFCSVYVVSQQKVTLRPSTSEAEQNTEGTSNDASGSTSTNTGSCYNSSSQTGIQHFQSLSTIIKDLPFSRSNSTGNRHSFSAFMDMKEREGTMHSSSNKSNVPYAGSRISSSQSLRTDWRWGNSDQATDASAKPFWSRSRSVAPPQTPRTPRKEAKQ